MDIELTGNYPIIINGQETGEVVVTHEGLFWYFDAKNEMIQDVVRLSVFGDGGEGYLGVMSPEKDVLTLHKKLSRNALAAFPKKIDHCGKKGEAQYLPEAAEVELSVQDDVESTFESNSLDEENEASSPPCDENKAVLEEHAPPESDIPPPIVESVPPESNVPSSIAKSSPPGNETPAPIKESALPESDIPSPIVEQPPHAQMSPSSNWRICVLPCSLFSDIEAKSAIGEIKGALISSEGEYTRLAVPLSAVDEIGKQNIFCFDKSEDIGGTQYVICKIKNGKIIGAS